MLTSDVSSIEDFRLSVLPFLHGHGFGTHEPASDSAPAEAGTPNLKAFATASEPNPRIELSVLRGGANNRVYRVTDGTREAVLKHYFKNPNDPRDRFRAEEAFYDLVWSCGVRSIPEPLGWDSELRVGLFSFVHGRKLTPAEVTAARVDEAARFIVELNRCGKSSAAGEIQNASEACFSITAHLELVDRRVTRLHKLKGASPLDTEARSFVLQQLQPAWQRIRERIATTSGFGVPASAGQVPNTSRDPQHFETVRCLSPSDFGFHNALLTANNTLRFFDFEYAGWDDPAKLVCDFFCQPELPASLDHWDRFIRAIAEITGDAEAFGNRARLLLPAYQIKWCCIMLNDFLRADQLRRDFALDPAAAEKRKQSQFAKAREALKRVGP